MRVFLTFDVEDFINLRSIWSLSYILSLLEKYDLKGIFFITGHMAEKIKKYPQNKEQLKKQMIGYHSSSHSIRPGILEFCDVGSYGRAVEISLRKEMSHINPLTGIEEGIGGFQTLSEIFSDKKIVSFRAPFCAWAPPHLEALRELGITFDFSTNISSTPFLHKRIVFYPSPLWVGYQIHSYHSVLRYSVGVYLNFLMRISKNRIVVLAAHPSQFVNAVWWDSIYRSGELKKLRGVKGLPMKTVKRSFRTFEFFLRSLKNLDRKGLVKIMSSLGRTDRELAREHLRVHEIYNQNLQKYLQGYRPDRWKPKHLLSHFERFFIGFDDAFEQ